MTWEHHPRIEQQKADRQKLLAGVQWREGMSREELAAYFAEQSRINTDITSPVTTPIELNGFDYAGHHFKPIREWGK